MTSNSIVFQDSTCKIKGDVRNLAQVEVLVNDYFITH